MATIQEVILNNNWSSVDFEQSTEVNRLLTSGIINKGDERTQGLLDGVSLDNVQSTITTGVTGFDFQEPNIGDASDDNAVPLKAHFDDVTAKVFYQDQWWQVHTIQKDLLSASAPEALVLSRVGTFWANHWNRIITSTLSGLSTLPDITIGDGTGNFGRGMIDDARQMKGDMGYGKLAKMFMNSKTLHDIIKKQNAKTIDRIITQAYGQNTIDVDGVATVVSSTTPEYVYDGVTPIVVDDQMKEGIISLVDEGAFSFLQKDFTGSMMYGNDPLSGKGVGKESWGTKTLFMMHPSGFSFKGVKNTNYASNGGLTYTELQGGNLYELAVDKKLNRIVNLKVKIGA